MSARKIALVASAAAILALGAAGYRSDLPYQEVKASYETASSHWVDVDGAQIHYSDIGSGPALVLVHGSGADLGAYREIATSTAALGYRVVSLDLPGSGLSLAGPNTGFSNADNVAFLTAFLGKLNIQPEAIVGHSSGGQIAWTLALNAPDLAKRLILIAPTGQPTSSPLAWKVARLPVLGPMLKNITPEIVVRQNLKETTFDDSTIKDEAIERYHKLLLREGARDALFERMQHVTFERIEELPCLTAPTLLLWGQEDSWLPASLGTAFEEALPDAKLITLPMIGHNLPEEVDADLFARLLDDWMQTPLPSPSFATFAPCQRAVTH